MHNEMSYLEGLDDSFGFTKSFSIMNSRDLKYLRKQDPYSRAELLRRTMSLCMIDFGIP